MINEEQQVGYKQSRQDKTQEQPTISVSSDVEAERKDELETITKIRLKRPIRSLVDMWDVSIHVTLISLYFL